MLGLALTASTGSPNSARSRAPQGRRVDQLDDVEDGIKGLEPTARLGLSGAMITEYAAEDRHYDPNASLSGHLALDLPLSLVLLRALSPEACIQSYFGPLMPPLFFSIR